MAQLPGNPQQMNQQQAMSPMVVTTRRRWRFRWGLWLGVPLACLAAAWFLQAAAKPSFDFVDVMELVRVPARSFDRYTELCVLGLVLIAIVTVIRVLRSRNNTP
jgi:hypothetical protein